MITTFNTVPLLEVTTPQSFDRLVQSFVASPLPAFVLRTAGATFSDALANIQPHLTEAFTLEDDTYLVADNEPGATSENHADKGIHVDLMEIQKPDITPITLHFTEKGTVDVSFFLPGPEILDRVRTKRFYPLPDKIDQLFREGHVDRQFSQPTCYRARLHATDLVVFKDGMPLVHDFTTITGPRVSSIKLGKLQAPNLALNTSLLRK